MGIEISRIKSREVVRDDYGLNFLDFHFMGRDCVDFIQDDIPVDASELI